MSPSEAKTFIVALANAIDPETGEDLSGQSVFNNPKDIRALFLASNAIDKSVKRENRKNSQPDNAGNAWSETEDNELLNSFDAGMPIKNIAAKYGRTHGAISARLLRFGLVKQ